MLLIDLDFNKDKLSKILQEKAWISKEEKIREIEKPGEGNMNVVMRIKTQSRNYILKQSRPYVNKYQQIPAPLDRIDVEYQFYQNLEGANVEEYIPKILAYDADNYLMLMEDLGQGQDMSSFYEERQIPPSILKDLVQFLSRIHHKEVINYPANKSLRELNHQHIFVLPFLEENGFQLDDIQSGLQDLSLPFKKNKELKAIISNLGEKYLSEGQTLIHGDYYPGSWLASAGKSFVIDPEFSFLGFPEFDLGVMAAHLIMITGKEASLGQMLELYEGPFQESLVHQIAGVEIMRRLIGLAQLNLSRSLEEKRNLLATAQNLILS